jgi:hypothetical protein
MVKKGTGGRLFSFWRKDSRAFALRAIGAASGTSLPAQIGTAIVQPFPYKGPLPGLPVRHYHLCIP